MSDESNEPVIRQAFEECLINGLKPQPLVTKDGPVVDPTSGELLTGPPDAPFLSVARAYLKDIQAPAPATPGVPAGKPRANGLMDQFMAAQGKGLPFGRPQ